MARRRSPLSRRRLPTTRRQVVLLVVALLVLALAHLLSPDARTPSPESLVDGPYAVEAVIDGDTLVLAGCGNVRLIGADTPETVKPNTPVQPWGPEATEFTRQFVASGQVMVHFDGPRVDKYGRVLAHVEVDGRSLGEELIRAGLATPETQYRYSPLVKARYQQAEAEARQARRGIWSQQAP